MSKISEIEGLLKQAMRDRAEVRLATFRLVLTSLRREEKDLGRPLSNEEELRVLQRERKQRIEAAEAFAAADRHEQAESESTELEIIEELMPERMSEEELIELIDIKLKEMEATSLKDIGRVMSDLMSEVAGRADGAVVSKLVRERLA